MFCSQTHNIYCTLCPFTTKLNDAFDLLIYMYTFYLSFAGLLFVSGSPRWTDVIRSPKLNAIPCVLERIRMYPASFPSLSSFFSTLTFTRASSPNTLCTNKYQKHKSERCVRMNARLLGEHIVVVSTVMTHRPPVGKQTTLRCALWIRCLQVSTSFHLPSKNKTPCRRLVCLYNGRTKTSVYPSLNRRTTTWML